MRCRWIYIFKMRNHWYASGWNIRGIPSIPADQYVCKHEASNPYDAFLNLCTCFPIFFECNDILIRE